MAKFNPAKAGQNFGDSFEKIKKPEDTTGMTLERMGVFSGKTQTGQQKQIADEQKAKIAQKIAQDRAQSQKRITELEADIRKLRLLREEQLRRRRQPPEPTLEQLAAQQEQSSSPPTAKRKRGLFGGWGRRIKTAQEQFQPETAGRRVGG